MQVMHTGIIQYVNDYDCVRMFYIFISKNIHTCLMKTPPFLYTISVSCPGIIFKIAGIYLYLVHATYLYIPVLLYSEERNVLAICIRLYGMISTEINHLILFAWIIDRWMDITSSCVKIIKHIYNHLVHEVRSQMVIFIFLFHKLKRLNSR